MLKTSTNGLNAIKLNEGFRSKVYLDSAGKRTIGFGHLVLPFENFPDSGITEEQATTILMQDVEHVEIYLNAAMPGLYQNEFDALIDFGFNLGVGALHLLLSHGIDQIPTQILLWDHAGGVVIEGLLERRQRELATWNLDNNEGV